MSGSRFVFLKILPYLRRRFIDAPRGFGHPVPASAFDQEFCAGHWQLLDSAEEHVRYTAVAALIRSHHSKSKLLDAGCGSGRLFTHFQPNELASYHGVDFSAEAIRQARAALPLTAILEQGNLETWIPSTRYDVIVINEVIGYFHDPAATLVRLAGALEPEGILAVSLYQWGNAAAIWRRLNRHFKTLQATAVTTPHGKKTWDLRLLMPITGAPAPNP